MSGTDEGFTLLTQGEFYQAQRFFSDIVNKNPKDTRAWRGLGRAFLNQRNLNQAVEAFSNIVNIQPNDPIGWLELACAAEEANKITTALRSFKRAMDHGADPTTCLDGMARCHQKLGDIEGAYQRYYELVQIDPKRRDTWSKLAQHALEQQDYYAAASYLSKALELQETAEDWYKLGVCFFHQQQEQNAETCWKRSMELDPLYTPAVDALTGRIRK